MQCERAAISLGKESQTIRNQLNKFTGTCYGILYYGLRSHKLRF